MKNMPKKHNQWFGPAKVNNSGFGVYSWKGWVSIVIFITLVIIDIIVLSKFLIVAIIIAFALISAFTYFIVKHGAKFTNNNLR